MARKPQHATYDIDLVRQAASGRWPEILANTANVDPAILDGQGHPCPKCGGTDRFHAITSDDRGGAICRQCFAKQNGDGFAVLQWLAGIDFKTSLDRIAGYLGITPTVSTNGSNGKSNGKRGKKTKPAPDEKLEFQPWNAKVVGLWALNKPPITADAVRAAGGRLARYRGRHNVVAIPIWGPKLGAAPPVGWVLFNVTGGTIPRFQGKNVVEQVAVKVTYGSEPGLMLSGVGEGQSELPPADLTWKVEGSTDFLAVLSAGPPPNHRVASNAFGTDEIPSKTPWIVDHFADQHVVTIHDADQPGERGAMTWAASIAVTAASSRRARLPYEIVDSHGKDIRDYLQEGHTYADLLELAAASEPVEPGDMPAPSPATAAGSGVGGNDSDEQDSDETNGPHPIEDEKDPHRLAAIYFGKNPTLKFWRQEWYRYDGRRYYPIDKDEIKAEITSGVKSEFDRLNLAEIMAKSGSDNLPSVAWVTRSLVSNVLGALEGMAVVPGNVEQNSWLDEDGRGGSRQDFIAARNGILDINALISGAGGDVLRPHSPRWFSTICLPFDYDPHADCPRWMTFLDKNLEQDEQRISILQEWAGYLLTPDTSFQRFLILEGQGSNGKSVYSAAITAMLGVENASHVPLECFAGRFDLTETLGKLANVVGDVGEIDKVAEGRLKSFTSGDRMFFDRKGIRGVSMVPTARLMMCCNVKPRIADRSQGVWRRMILMPFRVQIGRADRVAGMDKPDWWLEAGDLPGILNWAIAGLHRLRSQGDFTYSEVCAEAIGEYQSENNPASVFLTEGYSITNDQDAKTLCKDLYSHYRRWAETNGFKPINSKNFGREVAASWPGIERKKVSYEGRREWAYMRLTEVEENSQEPVF